MPVAAARSHGSAAVAPLDVLGQAWTRLLDPGAPGDDQEGGEPGSGD
jgi:hypothetical protein